MQQPRRRVNADESSERPPGELGKTKRAHDDDLGGRQPPLGAQAHRRDWADSANNSTATRSVAFRALVQHRVSAYVTWPAQLHCVDDDDVTSGAAVAGYIFRYRAVESPGGDDGGENPPAYAVRNLAVNFVLLDNLLPGIHYRYQVRYVPERGEASAWSQEGQLDTTPPLQRHLTNP